jgi:hypothetical protein
VVNHIKDEMQKNLNVDSTGARTGSPAKIDAIVRELDKDGKLDVIFGKKGAERCATCATWRSTFTPARPAR